MSSIIGFESQYDVLFFACFFYMDSSISHRGEVWEQFGSSVGATFPKKRGLLVRSGYWSNLCDGLSYHDLPLHKLLGQVWSRG